jgi:hypothetical protein
MSDPGHAWRRRIGVLTNRFAVGAGSRAEHATLAGSRVGGIQFICEPRMSS